MDWLHGGFHNRQLPWGRFLGRGLKPKGTPSRENFGEDISEAKGNSQDGHIWSGRSHQQVKVKHYPEPAVLFESVESERVQVQEAKILP